VPDREPAAACSFIDCRLIFTRPCVIASRAPVPATDAPLRGTQGWLMHHATLIDHHGSMSDEHATRRPGVEMHRRRALAVIRGAGSLRRARAPLRAIHAGFAAAA
jgi:hypothetical protein